MKRLLSAMLVGFAISAAVVPPAMSWAQTPDILIEKPLAVINGPTETPVGELVEFDAGDSVGAGYDWKVLSSRNTEGRWRVYENGRVLAFASPEAGTYKIVLSVSNSDLSNIAVLVVQNGTDPGPEPDPDPDPVDPVDPPPGTKWAVSIIYEKDDLDELPKDQHAIIKSLTFRERLKTTGHRLVIGGITDQHVTNGDGDMPKQLAPYLETAKGKELPALCISPVEGGGTVKYYPLPKDQDATLALLNGETK